MYPVIESARPSSTQSPQADADLRREVEKLRQEVDALRGRITTADISPKSITASRWLSVDRQGYDEIYVVNFQVLNDTYRKILQASLPGVHAEDVVFTWSVVRNIAQQIIYDPQKMVERGPVPFVASDLKYAGARSRSSIQQPLGSIDLSTSPGTEGFTSFPDVVQPFDVDTGDVPMGPPITPAQMGAAISGTYQALARPGPSQPRRTQLTALAETLGQGRRDARSETGAAPPSTGPPGDRNSSASAQEPTSPATSAPKSTVTTLTVTTPSIPTVVETSAPPTPGEASTTRSQSSRTSSAGKKRKTYAAMSTGGKAPIDRSVRPPEARETLRAGLRPRSERMGSLALTSDGSDSESDEDPLFTMPKGKRSKSRRESPEIAKRAANEAAKKAAPRPQNVASASRAQRESTESEDQSSRRSESRQESLELEYDDPEKPDYTKGVTEFYSVDWDALTEQFKFYRKRKDSVLFGGTAELKARCAVVDQYTERLPDRKAHQLRSVVEIAVQCQFPARAFVVGLDPRVTRRERQPTPEETAAYNWIRRIMSNDEAPWEARATARLHAKLMRLLTEKARWTAADLIQRCRRQIPELGSQLSMADGYGDTRATIIAGPACGASILMGLLSDIDEQIRGPSPDTFDHVDLMPGSRVQLTLSAMALLTPSLDLFDMFLVALDPGNVHRRHAERRPLPEAHPSDPAAELIRYLGPPENYRYDDLEFATPLEWKAKLGDETQVTTLRGAPGTWHRAFPHGRVPAWITFAGFAPGLEYGGTNEKTKGTVKAMLENLLSEYRRYRRDPEAELPSAPRSVTSPRVVDLRHSPFVFNDLLALPNIVVEQCTRRSEFSCGPSRDNFSPENIVVVAFSVHYRSVRCEGLPESLDGPRRQRNSVLGHQRTNPRVQGPRNHRRRRCHYAGKRALALHRGQRNGGGHAARANQIPRKRLFHRRMEPRVAIYGSQNRRAGVDGPGSGRGPVSTRVLPRCGAATRPPRWTVRSKHLVHDRSSSIRDSGHSTRRSTRTD